MMVRALYLTDCSFFLTTINFACDLETLPKACSSLFPPCMELEPVKYRDAVCPSCHNWKLCYSTGVQLIAIWPSTDRPQDK